MPKRSLELPKHPALENFVLFFDLLPAEEVAKIIKALGGLWIAIPRENEFRSRLERDIVRYCHEVLGMSKIELIHAFAYPRNILEKIANEKTKIPKGIYPYLAFALKNREVVRKYFGIEISDELLHFLEIDTIFKKKQ